VTKSADCPNCNHPVEDHPANGCVLAAFIRVLEDRGVDKAKLEKLHAECWVDNLWDDVGPILDRLEEGHYSGPRP
jgi:hypothetical protein